MSSKTNSTDPSDDCVHSDTASVLKHTFEGTPLAPEIASRVDERAARITAQVRLTNGVISDKVFQLLLADGDAS